VQAADAIGAAVPGVAGCGLRAGEFGKLSGRGCDECLFCPAGMTAQVCFDDGGDGAGVRERRGNDCEEAGSAAAEHSVAGGPDRHMLADWVAAADRGQDVPLGQVLQPGVCGRTLSAGLVQEPDLGTVEHDLAPGVVLCWGRPGGALRRGAAELDQVAPAPGHRDGLGEPADLQGMAFEGRTGVAQGAGADPLGLQATFAGEGQQPGPFCQDAGTGGDRGLGGRPRRCC